MRYAQCFCVEKQAPTNSANEIGILPPPPTVTQNCITSLYRGKSFLPLSPPSGRSLLPSHARRGVRELRGACELRRRASPLPPPDGVGLASGPQLAGLGDCGDKGRPRPLRHRGGRRGRGR